MKLLIYLEQSKLSNLGFEFGSDGSIVFGSVTSTASYPATTQQEDSDTSSNTTSDPGLANSWDGV